MAGVWRNVRIRVTGVWRILSPVFVGEARIALQNPAGVSQNVGMNRNRDPCRRSAWHCSWRMGGRHARALALLLVLLSACDRPGETPPSTGLPVEVEAGAPAQAGDGEAAVVVPIPNVLGRELSEQRYDLEGLKAAGQLRVLVGYSHTHYFMDGLHIRGISAENLKAFDPFLHEKLGSPRPKVNLLPIPVARDEMIRYLAEGKGDIAVGNITVTDERAELVDFSAPLRREVAEVIVHGASTPPIDGLDGLAGRTVHVRASSSFRESLGILNEALEARGLAPVIVEPLDEHLQTEDVLELVSAGVIGMTVADDYMAAFWAGVLDGIVVREDLPVRTGRHIAWAIRRDLPGMKPIVDAFVRRHREGTLVGNVLFQRYLRDNEYVHNASASSDRKRFLAMADLFRRYSTEYEFDWLLIAAQAYQESRLIQNRRSPAGAVGVMQLLPATALAPPVAIPNIEELEANIHAGHKYLRHITDHYFDDPELDELNRHLFAFAAYNAGPTRISRLRREAARSGLDANEWFGSVERLVAQKVGMEPVTYVRNIFKYYVTYSLMQDKQGFDPAVHSPAGGCARPSRQHQAIALECADFRVEIRDEPS